jgi:hypothetical protein
MTLEKQTKLARKVLAKIRPIPENKFIESMFTNGKDKCCVIGHLERISKNPQDFSMRNCSDRDFNNPARSLEYRGNSLVLVNNHRSDNYPQESPKKRVLAFLRDILRSNRERIKNCK